MKDLSAPKLYWRFSNGSGGAAVKLLLGDASRGLDSLVIP